MEPEQLGMFGRPDALDMRAPAQRRSHASRRAAEQLQASRKLPKRLAKILTVFRAVHPQTLISSEIEAATKIMRQSLTAPIAELRSRQMIAPVGMRVGPYKAEQTSYRITDAGLAKLREFESAPPHSRSRPR